MFTGEIVSLHHQGFTSGAIAKRLSLAPNYVRSVLSAQLAGREVKSSYVEAAPPPAREHMRKVAAVKRTKAEAKRAEALRMLAEANADLEVT